jgi:GT2 family glycosyltransferase
MDPLVSVIVVNHNRAELLRQCLRSLLEQTYVSTEILVVDNGSSDHSRTVVESFTDAPIRLLALECNRGFAGGNNVAIREAEGDFIALMNNDAMADPGWIEALIRVAQSSEEKVGMYASKILFSQTDVIDKAGHMMYLDGQNRGRGTGERDQGQYEQVEETFFPDGCAALYRRQMLEEVEGFDESFFAYGDDADLGVRCRWLGWKCLYVPEAVVHHRHSSTVGRFSSQKVYWVERNRMWLAVKNFPLPLLIISPLFTLNRWMWNFLAALLGRGAVGNFRRSASLWQLFLTLSRAYRDGFGQFGEMLQKRRRIRRTRRIGDIDFYRLVLRFRLPARVLAFQDTDF